MPPTYTYPCRLGSILLQMRVQQAGPEWMTDIRAWIIIDFGSTAIASNIDLNPDMAKHRMTSGDSEMELYLRCMQDNRGHYTPGQRHDLFLTHGLTECAAKHCI